MQATATVTPVNASLEGRLDDIAWGLLFLLIGLVALPGSPAVTALAMATGGAMLAVNAARRYAGLPVGWLSTVLGVVVMIAALGALAGVAIDLFAAFFIVLGVVVTGTAALRRH